MTIAFAQVFWFVAVKAHGITGGEDGLLKIVRLPADFGFAAFDSPSNVALYLRRAGGLHRRCRSALWRLVHSPFGRVVKAVKQNEERARFIGYDVWRCKFVDHRIVGGAVRAWRAACSRWRSARPSRT